MQKSDFYFHLPKEQIAQQPARPRDSSRLMVLQREEKSISHAVFSDIVGMLHPGDMLVANNSKVIPARLIGHKDGGGAVCELLLLHQQQADDWVCLAKPGKRLQEGARLIFGDGSLTANIVSTLPDGSKLARFFYNTQTLYEKLDAFGKMPLPPYITSRLENPDDYQTVYAKHPGSAAAPTAGLHFTDGLLSALREKGVLFGAVTLHVGLGTFRPVKAQRIEDHHMHAEWYSVSQETASAIRQTKANGGRVIAVGTTSCRTLESLYAQYGEVRAASGETDIFLYPGSRFHVIDGLLTNFHLPESTLIMLVSAFYGHKETMEAYRVAVEEKYRFFSFGDAMLIV